MKLSFRIPGSFHHTGLVLLGMVFVTSGRKGAIFDGLLLDQSLKGKSYLVVTILDLKKYLG
jgi:hypothetical protein